jgi:hypothetical protein
MLTHSSLFDTRVNAAMRPLSWRLLISFDKDFDSSTEFFTIGVSLIGGPDIIKGDGNILQEWDKYAYDDFSDRVLSMEITRQEDPVSSTALAMADIVLDNHDGFFSSGDMQLPKRPAKLYMGFGDESLPQFVGLTVGSPVADAKSNTVSFHLIDFMSSLFNRPLESAVLLQDVTTDEALGSLLQFVGISPTQYDLDPGFNIIPFVFFDKSTLFGDAAKALMGAEFGRLFMDETGVITFRNRQDYDDTTVAYYDGSNTIDVAAKDSSIIINVVEVTANPRAVQARQQVWTLGSPILIPAGTTQPVWANFTDPVVSVPTAPVPSTGGSADSSYVANTASDGSGASASLTLASTSLYSTSYLMNFTNSNSYDVYITQLTLFGEPARALPQIDIRVQDDTSVAEFDEQVQTIDNDYIQDASEATSKALILLGDRAAYGSVRELTVRGNPALQLADTITTSLPDVSGDYKVTKIVRKLIAAQLTDILTVKQFTRQTYFTIGVSLVGGNDQIAP